MEQHYSILFIKIIRNRKMLNVINNQQYMGTKAIEVQALHKCSKYKFSEVLLLLIRIHLHK